jgi:hypothetical protein
MEEIDGAFMEFLQEYGVDTTDEEKILDNYTTEGA